MNREEALSREQLDGALRDPGTYSHPVSEVDLVETHISVVALTGQYAYKVKKPVDFGFLDFSSLEKRQHFCEEELRLNQRTAAALYLGVLPLAWEQGRLRFGGSGPVAEWAVQMRQFAPGDRLDAVEAAGRLTDGMVADLAHAVARLHALELRPSALATTAAERLRAIFLKNAAQLPASTREQKLTAEFLERLQKLGALLAARARGGKVRECHGDLHLGNVCLWGGVPVLFDCIEFSEDLRVIDVLSDAAFLVMDLAARGNPSAAQLLLGLYLEETGDYEGLPAWPLFQCYRAHVRAVVAHLTARSPGLPAERVRAEEARRDSYLKIAEEVLETRRGEITILAGLPGSGKSTEALRRARQTRGLRIRSDVERKRLGKSWSTGDLYSEEATARTYQRLLECARAACLGGFHAVLDATHERREQRRAARALAEELGVSFRIVETSAPPEELRARVGRRRAAATDVSDADELVLERRRHTWEPFAPDELPFVERVTSP